MRLDYKSKFPSGMEEYLEFNGWHFNKKMCEWATSNMYKVKEGKRIKHKIISKEQLEELIKVYNINIPFSYDALYIANMCKADFFGDSVKDEGALARYVDNVMNDPDGYDGMPFTRFYADCIGKGTPIPWDDVL